MLTEQATIFSSTTSRAFTPTEASAYVEAKRADGYEVFNTDKGVFVEKGSDVEFLRDYSKEN